MRQMAMMLQSVEQSNGCPDSFCVRSCQSCLVQRNIKEPAEEPGSMGYRWTRSRRPVLHATGVESNLLEAQEAHYNFVQCLNAAGRADSKPVKKYAIDIKSDSPSELQNCITP